MKYRALSPTGDFQMGGGLASFYVNSPQAVAQAVVTRLKLFTGEWFLDTTDGTDWFGKVLGKYTQGTRDAVIRERILDTPGVNVILSYSSQFNSATRTFTVNCSLDTIYGVVPVLNVPLPISGIATV